MSMLGCCARSDCDRAAKSIAKASGHVSMTELSKACSACRQRSNAGTGAVQVTQGVREAVFAAAHRTESHTFTEWLRQLGHEARDHVQEARGIDARTVDQQTADLHLGLQRRTETEEQPTVSFISCQAPKRAKNDERGQAKDREGQ